MAKFQVSITELARYDLTVEASSEDEASEKAEAVFLESLGLDQGKTAITCEVLERDIEAEPINARTRIVAKAD